MLSTSVAKLKHTARLTLKGASFREQLYETWLAVRKFIPSVSDCIIDQLIDLSCMLISRAASRILNQNSWRLHLNQWLLSYLVTFVLLDQLYKPEI